MRLIRDLAVTVLLVAVVAVSAGIPATALAQDEPADTGMVEKTMEEAADSAKAGEDLMKAKMEETAKGAAEKATDTKPATATDTKPAAATESKPAAATESKPAAAEEKPVNPNAPYESVTFEKGAKPQVVMETSMGTIVLELWPDVAPLHCQSFAYLINKGFYDSLTFHRIVPGFVIQGGDPLGNGTGGPGYNVPAEFSNKPHEDGVLSMARGGDPNSAGSQFFICLGRLASLDNKYTVFGKVIQGLDIVHKIEQVPVQGERPKTPVHMTKVAMKSAAGE